MSSVTTDVARGLVLDGRYRIEEVVGQGGMSTVYRAHDEVLGRDVAVKLFPPTPDADEILRHEAEINVLAQLHHPGLVTLLDAGSDYAGGPVPQSYIVMELVLGPTLADLLETGRLSPEHTAHIGSQLADALVAVHEGHVVHRDVKPANVLIVDRALRAGVDGLGSGPVVKLADFGIARVIDAARLTVTGTTMGTATYLSPEQAAGGAVGPATDVYALGLVLLECLTGEKAFSGTVVEVAAARLNTSPRIPEELGNDWVDLLRGMTTRDAAERMTVREAALSLRGLAEAAGDTGPLPTVTRTVTRREDRTRPYQLGEPTVASPSASPVATPDGVPSPSGQPVAPSSAVAQEAEEDGPARVMRPRRRQSAALAAAAALVVLVLLSLGLVLGRGAPQSAPGARPEPPAIEGPLGDALEDLVESVQP